MSLKIKESELKDILAEVAEDLAKAFKSTEDKLAKAEPVQKDAPPAEAEETPGEDHAGSPPAEGSESAPPDASAPAGDASAPPDASAPAASPDATPSPEGVDPAAEQAAALTPEALQAEYSKLAPEELDMHIKAALAAKAALAGAPDAGGLPAPDASAAPAPDASASPAPPAAPPAGPPAFKNELPASPERKGKDSIDSLGKSEFEAVSKKQNDEIEALKALVKSQAEDIENLAKVAKAIVEQPLRKAVTSVAHLPKVEEKRELTKEAIHARLRTLSAKPDLKKSDRQLITDFYDGRIKADALAPLFEDYK